MPDIRIRNFAGSINSPNPFWLASAPPTNCGEQIMRAFDAGWGGAVWKTIGEPITNVSSRYSATDWNGQRIMGFNNIELISDRSIEENLREMTEVKKRYPQHAVIAVQDAVLREAAAVRLVPAGAQRVLHLQPDHPDARIRLERVDHVRDRAPVIDAEMNQRATRQGEALRAHGGEAMPARDIVSRL